MAVIHYLVQDPVWWPMRDQQICTGRDQVPVLFDGRSPVAVKSPVKKFGSNRRPPNPDPFYDHTIVI